MSRHMVTTVKWNASCRDSCTSGHPRGKEHLLSRQKEDNEASLGRCLHEVTMSPLPLGSIRCIAFVSRAGLWREKHRPFSAWPPLVSVPRAPAFLSLVSNRVWSQVRFPRMAALQPLQALNKSSARVATFAVRPCGGRVARYTYTSKKDQRAVTAHKFEAWVVGTNPQADVQ